MGPMYRELHGNTHACGENSSGLGESSSETALVEAGTERCFWSAQKWVSFGQRELSASISLL